MSNFVTYMNRLCVYDAVYWGNPQPDGKGGMTHDNPINIKCFWIDESQTVTDDNGDMWTSQAQVYVLQNLDQQGILWKGKLSNLTDKQKSNPLQELSNARQIKRFEKTPSLRQKNVYMRKAYIGYES